MDEPCSALDPISTLAIEDLIGKLKSTYTIVIVTHNMQQAARVSDRTGFFNLAAQGKPGRLIEMDDTQKIFNNPSRAGHRGLHLRPLRLTPRRLSWPSGPGLAVGSGVCRPIWSDLNPDSTAKGTRARGSPQAWRVVPPSTAGPGRQRRDRTA